MRNNDPKGPGSVRKSEQGRKPETSQNQPKPAKQPQTRIPSPQVARIINKFIRGQSQREIARVEGRDRETIARIVRSNEVQLYVARLRMDYIGLGSEAINTMGKVLRKGKDPRTAHQLLSDIGAVPSERERDTLLSGDSKTGNLVLDILKRIEQFLAEDRPNDKPDTPPK